ncbi:diamine acetyltransferase 1-like [Petromyzon marinus]|uniref:diamine acetyltransferase 1-like n=1 Tax=Petromyzon marinus TaxID=7757 RepID=UPI003F6F49E1
MSKFSIRRACVDDCCEILRLIKELAMYEKLGDEVHITEQELRDDGFGGHAFYQCLVAEAVAPDGPANGPVRVVGFAMFYFTYDPWSGRNICLEDFFVMKEYRGLGIGSEILKRVSQVAVESRCASMTFLVADWNAPSIEFYRRRGARDHTQSEGWHVFKMPLSSLLKLAAEE